MHICQLTRIVREHGIQGGMEQHSHMLTTGLTKRGRTVTTITTACPDCNADGNTLFLSNTTPQKYNKTWEEQSLAALRKVHQENPINVVWSQSSGGRVYVVEARQQMNIPCVVMMHGTLQMELNSRLRRLNTLRGLASLGLFVTRAVPEYFHWRKATPLVDHFIAASPATGKSALETMRIEANKLTVVPNGIDTERFAPNDEQKRLIRQSLQIQPDMKLLVTTSRLSEDKGIYLAVHALAALPDDVHLLVIGAGAAMKHLLAMAATLDLTRRVHFLGLVPNEELPKYLQASNIYLLPTMADEGGVPLALLKGMSTGLPVVATAIGGVPTAVSHEQTGLLIKIGSVDDLIASIRRLLAQPQLAQALGQAARDIVVERFSADTMVEQTLSVFTDVVNANRKHDGAI